MPSIHHARPSAAALAGVLMLALAGCQGASTDAGTAMSADTAKHTAAWTGPHKGLLAPFKERAFRYRTPLEVSDGGRFMRVPYDELIDINKRDELPVRKVKSWYVRKLPRGAEVEREYEAGGRKLQYWAMGRLSGGSKMTVIYLHGRGGNRDWGFDDERFGGNFNRLKNLMLNAGGAYLSPDFTDFKADGLADIKALIAKYRPLTSGKLIIACGSLGNTLCWNLAEDKSASSAIDGLVMLAAFPDDAFLSSPVVRSSGRHIPMMIAHGSWDPYYDYKQMLAFFRKLRKTSPDYPVRFILFDTGKHGAPLRMIDWRDTLNWIDAH